MAEPKYMTKEEREVFWRKHRDSKEYMDALFRSLPLKKRLEIVKTMEANHQAMREAKPLPGKKSKPDQSRLLTDEETQELSGKLIHIINKWHSGSWSTDADYSMINAENEIHHLYMSEVLPKLVAKTASIKDAECQARIEALIEEIGSLFKHPTTTTLYKKKDFVDMRFPCSIYSQILKLLYDEEYRNSALKATYCKEKEDGN